MVRWGLYGPDPESRYAADSFGRLKMYLGRFIVVAVVVAAVVAEEGIRTSLHTYGTRENQLAWQPSTLALM